MEFKLVGRKFDRKGEAVFPTENCLARHETVCIEDCEIFEPSFIGRGFSNVSVAQIQQFVPRVAEATAGALIDPQYFPLDGELHENRVGLFDAELLQEKLFLCHFPLADVGREAATVFPPLELHKVAVEFHRIDATVFGAVIGLESAISCFSKPVPYLGKFGIVQSVIPRVDVADRHALQFLARIAQGTACRIVGIYDALVFGQQEDLDNGTFDGELGESQLSAGFRDGFSERIPAFPEERADVFNAPIIVVDC